LFGERRGSLTLAALALFFVSGGVGLVYQVVWLRQLTLIFGATAYASSAVLSTFMGGLALGSYWAGRRADRWNEPPLVTYGKLELGITLYAAATPWLLGRATPLLELAWRLGADRHFALFGLVKFVAIVVLILPATTLMGATLPVLSRIAARAGGEAGAGVGRLYAVNTFGAVAGTVIAAFVALPSLGMSRTLISNLAANAAVGIVAWFAGRRTPPSESSRAESEDHAGADVGALVWVFAASGFAAMVLEVAWTRSLALVLGSSVYAYASMLTAFLLGLASGAGSAATFLRRRQASDPRLALSLALGAAGLFSFLAAHAIQWLPRLFGEIYFRVEPSPEGWWLVQLAIALLVMAPTTYALGWVFPLGLHAVGAGRSGGIAAAVGRVYAANTVGTIVGAACGGFLLVPLVGVGATLLGVAVGQIILAVLPIAGASSLSSRRRLTWAAACAVLSICCIALRPSWDVILMNSGVYMNVQNSDPRTGWEGFQKEIRRNNELVYAQDGLTSSILVAWQPESDNLYLAVNGKTDASSRVDLETQILLGHLPLLFHPEPRDVAVIGLASGITVGAVATHPVGHIRVVEVERAMIEAARRFDKYNHAVLDDPRVSISINDARNEFQFNPADYDVIISEPSNPWLTVAANLFTEEFFRVGRTRLRSGGVFGQWVQTYSLTPKSLSAILASFHRVFPNVLVFSMPSGVDLMVLGSDRPLVLDVDELGRRTSPLWIRADLARIGIRDGIDVAAMLQTGGERIREVIGLSEPNTDDNGLVEFSAPKALYLDTQDANAALLQGTVGDPVAALGGVLRASQTEDSLRLELIRRWVAWEEPARAARAAGSIIDPALRSRAEALLTAKK
jgi:spermidine synthase